MRVTPGIWPLATIAYTAPGVFRREPDSRLPQNGGSGTAGSDSDAGGPSVGFVGRITILSLQRRTREKTGEQPEKR